MDKGERGMNPVAMTIINPQKEYWPTQGSNQRPPVLKSAMLQTELWGLTHVIHGTMWYMIHRKSSYNYGSIKVHFIKQPTRAWCRIVFRHTENWKMRKSFGPHEPVVSADSHLLILFTKAWSPLLTEHGTHKCENTFGLCLLSPEVSELKPSLLYSLLPQANTLPVVVSSMVPSWPPYTCFIRCFFAVSAWSGYCTLHLDLDITWLLSTMAFAFSSSILHEQTRAVNECDLIPQPSLWKKLVFFT